MKPFKNTLMSLFSALAVGLTVTAEASANGQCSAQSPSNRLPLIELYTSQGCSSCPPADRWLTKFSERNDVVPLSMHVAYWDYIGWKDPYAKAEFTQRQRWLTQLNKSSTVYTPGVFVAKAEFQDWSNPFMQQRLLERTSKQAAAAEIRLEKSKTNSKEWRVQAAVDPANFNENLRLFVATTRNGLVAKVSAGENHGRTLSNHHVVEFWSGGLLPKVENKAELKKISFDNNAAKHFEWQGAIPALTNDLVAFVQDVRTGEVLQAFRMNVKQKECLN